MNAKSMMTVRELAALLQLSEYTIREKARNREFKFAKKIGNGWRFNRESAMRYAGYRSEADTL